MLIEFRVTSIGMRKLPNPLTVKRSVRNWKRASLRFFTERFALFRLRTALRSQMPEL
jgi:hypothetical protein